MMTEEPVKLVSPLASRETAEPAIAAAKKEWEALGRKGEVLLVSNVTVREMMKWLPMDKIEIPGGGGWRVDHPEVFGLRIVVSIYVKPYPGFIVVG